MDNLNAWLASSGLNYIPCDLSKEGWAEWVKAYNEHIDKIMKEGMNVEVV